MIANKPNSLFISKPCPSGYLTVDKREIKDSPKLHMENFYTKNLQIHMM